MANIKAKAIYGRPLTHMSYVFDFKEDIFLMRGPLFTALYGKRYPNWKQNEKYLELHTGRADELFLENGNVHYYSTNYDDEGTLMTFHTWGNYQYRSHFHVDVMWKVRRLPLIYFRDQVLTPIMKSIYDVEPPPLRRIALRYGNHALHRKRYFKS